ncbi:MAG: MFS transporter [Promethearchaeota archaeon]|jgi:MFS family permease
MPKSKSEEKVSFNRIFWPLYLLNGFQSIAYGAIIVLVVPLALIIWPNDPADIHALEMGILYTTLSWSSSFSGLLFGRLIDKYSRKKIIIVISIFRGTSMLFLGFTVYGGEVSTWWYFFTFITLFGFFSGGSWPAINSLSNDVVEQDRRSRFFGVYQIVLNTTNIIGWLIATLLVQNGFWREFFWGIGASILLGGLIFAIQNEEPKRGAQQEELYHVLQDDSIEYDFQINKEMMRKTMLSKTNSVALIEGIFTCILMSSLNFLILNYVQNPPYNLAPFSIGVFMVVFGLTGGLIGQIFLSRVSDKIAMKDPVKRLPIIVISIIGGLVTFALFFFLPWVPLTPEQGKNIAYIMTIPTMWIMGALFFTSRSIFSLYIVNQSPVIQQINLPEAQGQIVSWNQFLEQFGRGIGPLLCGVLLVFTGTNYQITVIVVILCIVPGVILWLLAIKWFPKDRTQIKTILKERAELLKSRS